MRVADYVAKFLKNLGVNKVFMLTGYGAMYLNDAFVESGVTVDAMGHPFESVAWLAGLLAGQGKQLRAGMIVMTGSTLATRFPTAGEEYSYEVEGLGTVSAALA